MPVLKLPPGGIFSCSQSDERVEPIQEIDDFIPFWEMEEEEEEEEEENKTNNRTELDSDQQGFDLYSKSARYITYIWMDGTFIHESPRKGEKNIQY